MKNKISIGKMGVMIALLSLFCVSFCVKPVKAAKNTNWQSVYVVQNGAIISPKCYIKYGSLSIARDYHGIYVKGKSQITYRKGGFGYGAYGGVLTNGKDIIYQDGRDIYLWKGIKRKIKLCSLPKKKNTLVAYYGNAIYYEKYVDYDFYAIYKYNLKSRKRSKLPYSNGYYTYKNYMIVNGQFHEGCGTPIEIYDMKDGKMRRIVKNGSFGTAAIIKNNKVYYTSVKTHTDGTNTYRSHRLQSNFKFLKTKESSFS